MEGSQKTRSDVSALTAPLTNTLACLWGAAAAYILCYSLLVTQRYIFALAALVPLVAAWATLERKRWGRMALMGLGMTTAGVFAFLLGAFFAFRDRVQTEVRSVGNTLRGLAALYDISATAAFGLVILAVVTVLWMLRREVKAEFNQNKRSALAGAQRAIATVLVCCWGGVIAFTPLTMTGGHGLPLPSRSTKTGPRHGGYGQALRHNAAHRSPVH